MVSAEVEVLRLADGAKVMIRAIRSTDASMFQAFIRRLSARSRRFRFFVAIAELSAAQLERFINVDHRRGMALVALSEQPEGAAIVAEARCVLVEEPASAEFAIAVADEFQRRGLGTRLVKRLLAYASGKGVRRLFGEIMADNHGMLSFASQLGFQVRANLADRTTMIASVLPSMPSTDRSLPVGAVK
jgi:acetyltransferase